MEQDREKWKALHLLMQYGQPTLSREQLKTAGVGCTQRVIDELLEEKIIEQDPDASAFFRLHRMVSKIMGKFVLIEPPSGLKLEVDYPEAFIVMPYTSHWSTSTYETIIKPAVEDARFHCLRADERPKVGQLTGGVLKGIMEVGIVIAEVSEPNPNVFYELGIAVAFGKPAMLLKQKESNFPVPVDFAGELIVYYERNNIGVSKSSLENQLKQWSEKYFMRGTKELANKYGR